MKTNYLFPNKFKKIGWFVLVPTLIIGIVFLGKEPEFLDFRIFTLFNDTFFSSEGSRWFSENNLFDEIIGVLLIVSSMLVAFSKEKEEDEFITNLRLKSLTRAVYVNYGILLISMFTVFGFAFFNVAIFNIFTFLLIFIFIFNFNLWRSKKSLSHEE
jgi:ABC-type glycerol-3-phosphate transport system permease component